MIVVLLFLTNYYAHATELHDLAIELETSVVVKLDESLEKLSSCKQELVRDGRKEILQKQFCELEENIKKLAVIMYDVHDLKEKINLSEHDAIDLKNKIIENQKLVLSTNATYTAPSFITSSLIEIFVLTLATGLAWKFKSNIKNYLNDSFNALITLFNNQVSNDGMLHLLTNFYDIKVKPSIDQAKLFSLFGIAVLSVWKYFDYLNKKINNKILLAIREIELLLNSASANESSNSQKGLMLYWCTKLEEYKNSVMIDDILREVNNTEHSCSQKLKFLEIITRGSL